MYASNYVYYVVYPLGLYFAYARVSLLKLVHHRLKISGMGNAVEMGYSGFCMVCMVFAQVDHVVWSYVVRVG